jgi:glycosyltransferase involved in cell wall biosynthesis
MSAPPPIPAAEAGICDPLYVSLVTETFPPEINGVANTLRHMRDGLHSAGHRVQLVRPRQAQDKNARSEAAAPAPNQVMTPGLPIPGYPGLHFGLPASGTLTRLWREQRPDLVYIATEGPLGRSALTAAQRLNIPTLSGMHTHFDRYSRHYRLGLIAPLVAAYMRNFHNRSGGTLVPTRAMADALRRNDFQRVHIWPRGVDAKLFDPARRSGQLRAEWGLKPDQLALLYVGRLAPEKNVELALQSYLAIKAEIPSTRIIWVGDGPARRHLEQACPDGHFAGARTGEDLATHYASGDLFLFPSLTETFGNVVLEAMASGLPVLAYRDAAAAELIDSGQDGRTVRPANTVDFIATGLELANNRDLCRRLGRAARQRALRHAWPTLIEALIALFQHSVEEHQHAPMVRSPVRL